MCIVQTLRDVVGNEDDLKRSIVVYQKKDNNWLLDDRAPIFQFRLQDGKASSDNNALTISDLVFFTHEDKMTMAISSQSFKDHGAVHLYKLRTRLHHDKLAETDGGKSLCISPNSNFFGAISKNGKDFNRYRVSSSGWKLPSKISTSPNVYGTCVFLNNGNFFISEQSKILFGQLSAENQWLNVTIIDTVPNNKEVTNMVTDYEGHTLIGNNVLTTCMETLKNGNEMSENCKTEAEPIIIFNKKEPLPNSISIQYNMRVFSPERESVDAIIGAGIALYKNDILFMGETQETSGIIYAFNVKAQEANPNQLGTTTISETSSNQRKSFSCAFNIAVSSDSNKLVTSCFSRIYLYKIEVTTSQVKLSNHISYDLPDSLDRIASLDIDSSGRYIVVGLPQAYDGDGIVHIYDSKSNFDLIAEYRSRVPKKGMGVNVKISKPVTSSVGRVIASLTNSSNGLASFTFHDPPVGGLSGPGHLVHHLVQHLPPSTCPYITANRHPPPSTLAPTSPPTPSPPNPVPSGFSSSSSDTVRAWASGIAMMFYVFMAFY